MHTPLALIRGETEALKRLILLMEEEQTALKTGNPESLPTIEPNKLFLIDTLDKLETERLQLIDPTQSSGDAKLAMQIWLSNHPDENETNQAWKLLLSLARQAKTLNELNGKLVAMHLNRTNQALSVMSEQRSTTSGLYGSNGQANPLTGSRIIDSA